MAFVITDGDGKYLTRKCKIVDSVSEAFKWKTITKAENVASHLPHYISDVYAFRVKSLSSDYEESSNECNPEVVEVDDDNDVSDVDIFSRFRSCLEELYSTKVCVEREKYLSNKISELDLMRVDIEHAIELNSKANVVDGYKYYNKLREVLLERRQCKDELQRIKLVKSTLSTDKANSIISSLDGVDNKIYTPRVLKDLFIKET